MTTSQDAPTALNPCVTDGIPLAWERRCIGYSIDYRGSVDLTMGEVQTVVDTSFSTWEKVTCGGQRLDFSVIETAEHSSCLEAQFRQNGPNVNTIAFVDDWDARGYDPDAIALTTVWHSTLTGEILDVDMQINEQLGPFAICPDTGCPGGPGGMPSTFEDLENVVTHEAGHFFGLAHSALSDATMYYSTAVRGETTRRTLTTDDTTGICTIYPPGSLPSQCDYTPRGGLKLECTPGDSLGCSIGRGGVGDRSAPTRQPAWLIALAVGLLWRRRRRP